MSGPIKSGAAIEWAVFGGITTSLLWPLGMMTASIILMIFGLWCWLTGTWRWQSADKPSAIMNTTFAAYAIGSAMLSWHHRDGTEYLGQYLPFLGAGLMTMALRVARLRPFVIGAAFALAAALAATASAAQVISAGEMHRAKFLLVGTTFGTMGALYAIICAGMLAWPEAAKSGWQRAVFIIGACCGIVVALLSGSKGSWLTLAVIGPFALHAATARYSWRKKLPWILVVAALAGAAVFIPNSPVIPRIKEALHEGDRCRAAYWKEATGLFYESPLTGAGRGEMNKRLDAAAMKVRNNIPFPEGPPKDAHNEYLDALATRGLPGLILVLAILGVPLAVLARLRPGARGPATAGILFVLALAVSGLTDVLFMLNIKRMTFLLFVLFCAMAASPGRNAKEES